MVSVYQFPRGTTCKPYQILAEYRRLSVIWAGAEPESGANKRKLAHEGTSTRIPAPASTCAAASRKPSTHEGTPGSSMAEALATLPAALRHGTPAIFTGDLCSQHVPA